MALEARIRSQTIVVIRTVPSQMFYTPEWFKRMERWLGESSLQPSERRGGPPPEPGSHR
jgi:predicted patatin/cPLA2 family phospholipase